MCMHDSFGVGIFVFIICLICMAKQIVNWVLFGGGFYIVFWVIVIFFVLNILATIFKKLSDRKESEKNI